MYGLRHVPRPKRWHVRYYGAGGKLLHYVILYAPTKLLARLQAPHFTGVARVTFGTR